MSSFRERRRYPRAIIEWPVGIKTARGTVEGVTLNISGGGATIRCQNPPLLYEVFEMTIKIPEQSQPLVVDAQVVWSSADVLDNELAPPMIGVNFTHIADHHRWLISTAVSIVLKHKQRDPSHVQRTRKVLFLVMSLSGSTIPLGCPWKSHGTWPTNAV